MRFDCFEFDRIEDFIERVRKYDPFRPVEHMERTARYNLFRRADGKYVAKSDRVIKEYLVALMASMMRRGVDATRG